jgi:uncharacterized membrane protein YkoI
MKIRRTITILALAGLFSMAGTLEAFAFRGEQYSPQAKVTIEQARSIAQKAVRGKIVSEELEKEAGGTGLRYSFDIKGKDSVLHEVGVDAKTGKVLERSIEHGND